MPQQGPDEPELAQSCQRKYDTNRYPNKEDSLAAVLDWCYNIWNSRNPRNKFKAFLGYFSQSDFSIPTFFGFSNAIQTRAEETKKERERQGESKSEGESAGNIMLFLFDIELSVFKLETEALTEAFDG